jgi:hypothetical protein
MKLTTLEGEIVKFARILGDYQASSANGKSIIKC